MRYEKTKGYLICAIVCFVLSGLLLCLGVVGAVMKEIDGQRWSDFGKIAVIVYLFIPWLVILGIACVWKNNVNKIVTEGKKGVCTITGIETHYSRRGRGVWMDVSFKDKRGEEHTHTQAMDSGTENTLKVGMHLECYILGDKCRIDENHIKIIDESSLSIDDSIDF